MTTRSIRIFRYDPREGGGGRFDAFTLDIPDESTTTILDVLLRVQREQDATLAFRYACRVNMCGSCAVVINGREALACKTNVSEIPAGGEITIRPLNHFPVIKDLVVDMDPFFKKYEDTLPFYEPRQESAEPARIRPDSEERREIGEATECIACGCCVSSCTMAHYHEGYAGPAALNRAFTLLADSRDGLFEARLARAMESCYLCRTEFNCTEVCPKSISSTRAIKYIQRLAVLHPPKRAGKAARPAEGFVLDRRAVLLGGGAAAVLAVIGAGAVAGPALSKPAKQWAPVAALDSLPEGVTRVLVKYQSQAGVYTEQVSEPVLVARTGGEIVCYKAACPHLGCMVRWDGPAGRFQCACHGGSFARDGSVLAGPPPRPLDRYTFRVDAGQILIEVG
ncbi:MAG: 2Fe-2S iron-sulfur cluster-binding protein [Bryobacteraceae bacterium]